MAPVTFTAEMAKCNIGNTQYGKNMKNQVQVTFHYSIIQNIFDKLSADKAQTRRSFFVFKTFLIHRKIRFTDSLTVTLFHIRECHWGYAYAVNFGHMVAHEWLLLFGFLFETKKKK